MTIVTFGVFDMLHLGHILLFKRARELGDRLIVAVQSDDYIRKYKPEAEVLYTIEQRLFMVRSIKYVDEVVVYNDVDIDIKHLNFDIFAKGPDQIHQGFVNAEQWCKMNGKSVVVIPRTEGISSTYLRDFI